MEVAQSWIAWEPPPLGIIKVNTDGAFRASSSIAGGGGLCRNSQGHWLTGFAFKIGTCSALEAELWGANLAWAKGFKKVILEVDSSMQFGSASVGIGSYLAFTPIGRETSVLTRSQTLHLIWIGVFTI
ncbi:nucleic acid binding protein, putative [Ricinus communis]|uniref:Nucleic acid binding protein, putative n=1 Tax=Ricinus communis TaxID=3988 RepID=B9SF16_RICCO|nr:nucleic acid binding protein, putative [Ricinus communis]